MNLSVMSQHVGFVLKSCLTELMLTLIRFDAEMTVHVALQTVWLIKGSRAAREGTFVALFRVRLVEVQLMASQLALMGKHFPAGLTGNPLVGVSQHVSLIKRGAVEFLTTLCAEVTVIVVNFKLLCVLPFLGV